MRELSDKDLADYLAGLCDCLSNRLMYSTYDVHDWNTGFRFPNGSRYQPCQDDVFVLGQAIDRLRQCEIEL